VAKKRVHEIAKAQGVSSKELLAALSAAGVEAKAAASNVEEAEALRALSSAGAGSAGGNGGAKAPDSVSGNGTAKVEPGPRPIPNHPQAISSGTVGSGPQRKPASSAPKPPASPPAANASPPSGTPAAPAGGSAGTGGGGKRRRRVVIDSQAARRDQMSGPSPQRPPRRRGGRRRRPTLDESPAKPLEMGEAQATKVPSGATVREVSELLDLGSAEVIKKLMMMGEMATLTQTLPDESIRAIAEEYDRQVEIVTAAEEETEDPVYEDEDSDLADRPPVVTIMGHVDHGKTSLLDAIRETEVVAGEAGGITQHIGAYQVHHSEKTITFLDTPGHQAFTAMRARGAKVTDVAVIVVAADDGVMPQTKEAIDHARAADVPILIAVNKVDKEGAEPDRVRNELAAQDLTPEEWGGETVYCDVSAKTHQGLENLLDMIILVTDLEELSANPDAPASGTVIESQLDPGRGAVVSVLVQRGTLRIGDAVVAGPQWGKVRAMHDYTGDRIQSAGPGMPVEVLGFDGVTEAGEHAHVVENDRRARQLASERGNRLKTEALARRQARKVNLAEVFALAQKGDIKELNIVLKADVAGSLEALQDELAKVPQDRVEINVIHAQTGGINESDVMLASASDAIIIGFNVRPLSDARRAAESEGVDVRTYGVIYQITEDLRNAMEGLLEALEVDETLGEAEVLETFRASKVGNIAGCRVTDGRITREANVRLLRDGTVVWTGKLGSLRRFKDDVREVTDGQECGIVLDGYGDVKVGDVLEFFETKKVEQTLE